MISVDEKSQLQALGRRHPTVPAGPGRPSLVEFEYRRGFGRLVDEVMNTEPYKSACRVFWVVDNGSSHCGRASVQRMADAYPQRG